MAPIPNHNFTKVEPLNKGWSSDKKYYVETADGERLLLRVADISEYERKRAEFDVLKRIAELNIPASRPVDFGVCDGGKSVYQLLTWIDGEDAETVLPTLSETEQYALGVKAGEILRKIHSIPAPENIAEWSSRYFDIIDERLDAYRTEGLPFNGNDIILNHIEKNRHLLKNLPQTFIHGDFNEANVIFGRDGNVYAIDLLNEFADNWGEPWQDLKPLDGCDFAHYSTGVVRGYFGGEPPRKFWEILNYYIIVAGLTAVVWYKYNSPDELPRCLQANENSASDMCNDRIVPTWYLKNLEDAK